MKFSELQLHPALQANLERIKFVDCTPIQDQAIPLLRKGKDLSGLAQTGTGKTGAFLIPLIDRVLKGIKPDPSVAESETVPFADWKKKQFILVLVPTRELCEQVQENAMSFTEGTGLDSVSIYGGTTYEKQITALKNGVEIVIATPGRFIDLYKDHIADLAMVRAVIFDEADRMFDMGFKDDMKFILRRIPRERQFLVFSATLNFEVLNTAYEYGADPVEINVSRDQAKAENVKDNILHVGQVDKPQHLLSMLKKFEPRQAIIFSNFKHNVERIAKFLSSNGVPAMGISSLLTQAQRNRVMEQFKAENDRNILVATDVAARGLDIRGVDMVINFDLPDDAENYVHRIGRTGRAGATGTALSMVGDRDVDALGRIEEYLKHKVEAIWLEDADLVKEFQPFPRDEHRGPPKRGGDRGGRPDSRGPRGDSRGPRGEGRGGPRGDRDRGPRGGGDRGPRPPRVEGGPRPEGGGPRQDGGPRHEHRDRNSGRHRDNGPRDPNAQTANGPAGGTGPRQEGGPRRDHPRGPRRDNRGPRGPGGGPGQAQRQGQSQGGRHGGGGGRPDHRQGANGPRRDQGSRPQGGRPHQGGPRPAAKMAGAKQAGIGKKVTGFFKKLFGGNES